MQQGHAIAALPWRRADAPTRVLAIRLQALGDTVITLPYLNALRRLLPNATLDYLTRQEVADIPKSVVLFDHVFEIGGARDSRRQLLSALALVPRLRLRRYDVVIDLQRNRISRAVRLLLNAPAWSEFDRFSPRPAGERTRATIEAVGLGTLRVFPDLILREADPGMTKMRDAGWSTSSEFIVLNPAGGFRGRHWPLESYARFAELWLRDVSSTTQFVVLGLPALAPKAAYLKQRLADRLLDLVGRTTPSEAFGIVQRAGLVVSEDSGLMHMAWVAGVPTLGLFAASSSTWSRPHGSYSDCLQLCRLADGACIDGECQLGPPACLDQLAPGTVLQYAQQLLQRASHMQKTL